MTLDGRRELEARLNAVAKAPRGIMRTLAMSAVREQKLLVPRKTSNLGRSIHAERITDTSALTVASAAYAMHVEFGTRPHEIRPRRAKALFFPSQKATSERFGASAQLKFTKAGRLSSPSVRKFGAGAYVHAKVVHHPGTKAQPYMRPGAERAIEKTGLAGIVIAAWNEAA